MISVARFPSHLGYLKSIDYAFFILQMLLLSKLTLPLKCLSINIKIFHLKQGFKVCINYNKVFSLLCFTPSASLLDPILELPRIKSFKAVWTSKGKNISKLAFDPHPGTFTNNKPRDRISGSKNNNHA